MFSPPTDAEIRVYAASNESEPFQLVVLPAASGPVAVSIGDFGAGITVRVYGEYVGAAHSVSGPMRQNFAWNFPLGFGVRDTAYRLARAGLEPQSLTAIIVTHEHADHTHGIDDLRPLFIAKRRRVPVYMDVTLAVGREIVFPAGSHSDALRMNYQDFEDLARPEICSFAAKDAGLHPVAARKKRREHS